MKWVRACVILSSVALLGLALAPVALRAGDDILEKEKQRQEIEAQRVEQEVLNADKAATQVGRTDPNRAVDILNNALAVLATDTALSAEKKAALKRRIDLSLKAYQGKQGDRTNPVIPPSVIDPRPGVDERARRDADYINKTMAEIKALQAIGRTVEANRLQDNLRSRYPDNPAISAGSSIGRTNDTAAANKDLRNERERGWLGAMASAGKSSIPPVNDI